MSIFLSDIVAKEVITAIKEWFVINLQNETQEKQLIE